MAAIGHAEPMELEAWREELRTVLESRAFRQAPTLAGLLRYLCEKLFAGESAQIKEYSIGVELFRRGDAFDQETDSIVRVEVNRLRKRLADYYAGEGASHKLQIVIPVGQYVPRFVSTVKEPEPEPQPVPEQKEEPPKAVTAWWRRPWVWAAGAAGVALVAGAVWFAAHPRPQAPQVPETHPAQAQTVPEPLVGPPPGDEVRILAGSTRSYADHADKLWSADAWYSGGTAVKNESRFVARTLDPSFYRASREGQFRYDIPLKRGVYEVHLYFAET
jgi:hypothetical protein